MFSARPDAAKAPDAPLSASAVEITSDRPSAPRDALMMLSSVLPTTDAVSGRALNIVYGVTEDRGFVRRKLTDLACALVVIVLFLIVLVAVFLGGGIADDLFDKVGLGGTAATVWSIVRWPIALLAASVGYGIVYAVSPNVVPRRFRWLSPGALLGVVLWLALSAAFGVYIQHFATYGAAYGAFGAAIVLLLWLYLSANAFLFGAEFNAELERSARMGGDAPPAPIPPPSADDPDGPAVAEQPADD